MTRINLVPPKELMDQHLLAEWREIKMVPASLRRSLRTKSIHTVIQNIPKDFVMGSGHVKFFFDKMTYLSNRYNELTVELINRGYSLYHTGDFRDFCKDIPKECFNDYVPTSDAYSKIRNRISEKINIRLAWYRYYGKSINFTE